MQKCYVLVLVLANIKRINTTNYDYVNFYLQIV